MADQFSDNPFDSPGAGAPAGAPPKKSLKWLWIILGVGGGGFLLCCGGCGLLAYFGLGAVGEQVKADLAQYPVVTAEVGTIEKCEMSISRTGAIAETNPDTIVFVVTGTNGTGEVFAKQNKANGQMILETFITSDGREIPLDE